MRNAICTTFAVFLLVVASLSIWQWRFIEVPDGIAKLELADPLVGWTAKAQYQYEIIDQADGPLLRLSRKKRSERIPEVRAWLKPAENVSAIHISCDARWEDVKVGRGGYMIARFVSMMKNREGKVMHPPSFRVTWGRGSKDWHHSETIMLITSDMEDYGLAISMLGDHGTMEVKNLSVTALRNRSWIPAATVFVVVGWVVLCYFLIRSRAKPVSLWRSFTASAFIVAAGWLFVFTQVKGQLHPVIGSFSIAREVSEELSSKPAPAEPLPKAKPVPQSEEHLVKKHEIPPSEGNPIEAVVPPKTSSPEPETKPSMRLKPVSRDSSVLYKFFRAVDDILPVAHFGLFAFITLFVLVVTGSARQWPLPLALAILSELVPELIDHLGGWDDWTDVIQNIAGVALAVFLYAKLKVLQRLSGFGK